MEGSLINFNGEIVVIDGVGLSLEHRAVVQAEIICQKIRLYDGDILFAERHYFHLMAQMRMARWEIPMYFTPDFFEKEIKKLLNEIVIDHAIIEIAISRNNLISKTDYWIKITKTLNSLLSRKPYEIEQYKESYIRNDFLARINFLDPTISIFSTFASENDLDDLLLLNSNKGLARTIHGNIFVIKGEEVLTPSLEAGALDNVFRDILIETIKRAPEFNSISEDEIFPFALMKADEVIVLKEGFGIQSVTKFRKKEYSNTMTQVLGDKFLELV